jgi:hypothetical protein
MFSRLALFLTAILLATAASGQEANTVPAITRANSQVYVGFGGQRLQYTEVIENYFGDSEIGKQYDASAGASWQGDFLGVRNLYVRGQTWFARGKTAYTGFLQSSSGAVMPYDSSTNVETTDYLVRLGKGFGNPTDGMIMPFVDLGGHRWVRDSSQSDPFGYLEVYKHADADVGVLAQGCLSERLVGSIEISAGSSFASQIGVPSQQVSAGLKHERLFGAALSFDYVMLRRLHAKIEYRQVSFHYGRSKVFDTSIGPAYEPDSLTYQGVAMFTLGYGL